MFRRKPQPAPDALTRATQAAEEAAQAAHRIAQAAERQAAIISAQADEIHRLRLQLAQMTAARDRSIEAAGYWYQKAQTAARRDLPAALAENLGRFISHN